MLTGEMEGLGGAEGELVGGIRISDAIKRRQIIRVELSLHILLKNGEKICKSAIYQAAWEYS